MTDETDLATDVAGSEAVQPEVIEAEAAEAPDSTKGQVEGDQPAEPEAEAEKAEEAKAEEERKTRNQRRQEAKARLRGELDAAKKAAETAKQELDRVRKAANGVKRPVEKDFASFDEYQAALASFSTLKMLDGRRVAELEEAAKGHFEAIKAREEEEARADAQAWESQMADGRRRYADFDEIALRRAPINSPEAARLVVQSDYAAEVAYALGKDEAAGKAFAEMESRKDWMGIARLVGRLEAQVTAPKPKIATDAPPPIAPVRGKSTATKRIEDMSPDEYAKYRDSGGTISL